MVGGVVAGLVDVKRRGELVRWRRVDASWVAWRGMQVGFACEWVGSRGVVHGAGMGASFRGGGVEGAG